MIDLSYGPRLNDLRPITWADEGLIAPDATAVRTSPASSFANPGCHPRQEARHLRRNRRQPSLPRPDALAERGAIVANDYDVPVKSLTGDEAMLSETSLAENFQRLNMTPADECRAFQHFLGEKGDIDAVAKRFGVTRRFIEGRLRLASLAEPIFDALAEGKITLDIAKAYASTGSHERQLMVWKSYGTSSYYNADSIRRVIANETLRANDPIALLVGAEAYEAAGGSVDRDLFSNDGDRWINPEIAQNLAAAMMEAEAK